MDEEKLKEMRYRGYRVVDTCSTCVHSNFKKSSPWGTCAIGDYVHEKHKRTHDMPAHVALCCKNHYRRVDSSLGPYGEEPWWKL